MQVLLIDKKSDKYIKRVKRHLFDPDPNVYLLKQVDKELVTKEVGSFDDFVLDVESLQVYKKGSIFEAAILTNDVKLVKLFIDKIDKKYIDKHDSSGKTPLIHAVSRGNVELVRLLLKYGANKYIGDKIIRDGLHLNLIPLQHCVCLGTLPYFTDMYKKTFLNKIKTFVGIVNDANVLRYYGRSFVDAVKQNEPNANANAFLHKLQNVVLLLLTGKALPYLTATVLIDRLDKLLNKSKTRLIVPKAFEPNYYECVTCLLDLDKIFNTRLPYHMNMTIQTNFGDPSAYNLAKYTMEHANDLFYTVDTTKYDNAIRNVDDEHRKILLGLKNDFIAKENENNKRKLKLIIKQLQEIVNLLTHFKYSLKF